MATAASGPCPTSPLETHPELRAFMGSETFRRIADEARVVIGGHARYLVHGDTMGTLDDLFLDALSRGSSAEGSDASSRALFLELPPHLQDAIRSCVRQDPPLH